VNTEYWDIRQSILAKEETEQDRIDAREIRSQSQLLGLFSNILLSVPSIVRHFGTVETKSLPRRTLKEL